jgi:hypothetical protein
MLSIHSFNGIAQFLYLRASELLGNFPILACKNTTPAPIQGNRNQSKVLSHQLFTRLEEKTKTRILKEAEAKTK